MAQIELRLNEADAADLLRAGDVFVADPDFGVVVNAYTLGDRLYVETDRDYDYLGLPSTVVVERADT